MKLPTRAPPHPHLTFDLQPELPDLDNIALVLRSTINGHLSMAELPSATLGSDSSSTARSSALQARISDVLSSSYSDIDIRDSLKTLDLHDINNTPESRRNLRLQVQQELIQCDGEIIQDFGQVAEVCIRPKSNAYGAHQLATPPRG